MINILTYNAVPDGKTLNTEIIQQAIDDLASRGGGTVVVPSGVYVTGTIWLRNNVELHLEMGAVLKGSTDLADYCTADDFQQNAFSTVEQWNGAHLIVGLEVNNVAITGPGTIDGSAPDFFEEELAPFRPRFTWAKGLRLAKDKVNLRPGQMCAFYESSNIRIENLSLRNSCCWTIFLHGCNNAFISGIKIDNNPDNANTDGIDIDCCDSVIVSNCIINTGDDAITLRGNPKRLKDNTKICQNIAITNCVLDCSVCAFRIGVGDGTITNAIISNICIRHAATGFLFQSAYWKPSTGTNISNISISNIQAQDLAYPIRITSGAESATAQIKNITITDFQADCYAHCDFSGSEITQPRNITIRNCHFNIVKSPIKLLDPEEYPKAFLSIKRVDNIRFDNVTVNWDQSAEPTWKTVLHKDDSPVVFKDCILPEPPNFAKVEAENDKSKPPA